MGQTESIEKGLTCFENQFVKGQTLNLYHRMLFVRNRMGEVVATASLWNGDFCGTECQRVHWVAVRDDCSGKGIAKALLTRILDLYNQLGFEGFIYLETGTRYYPAIGLYRKFGFTEYTGEISLDPKLSNEEYAKQNQIALDIINTKLNSYHNKK